MQKFRISCLWFICFLTSLTLGDNAPEFTKLKKSKDIFLSFKALQTQYDPLRDEEIIEEIRELEPNVVYYLHVEFIPDWVQFIVLQAHVYMHNATLGYNIDKVPHKYVTGQNIGLFHNISSSRTAQFFLESTKPFFNVTALLAVVAYNKNAPVPGGCNMEFEVDTAPWLRVNVTGPTVVVSSQPARGPHAWGIGGACDLPILQYQAYHLYLPEKNFLMDTYFDFLRRMMTYKRITQNGRRVPTTEAGEMKHVFSAYRGTGSVYVVVVAGSTGQYAAYVPALTYTCSPVHYTDSCQVLTSAFSRSLCALVLFIGLFVCFFGHSFFKTELFLMSTLVGGIVTYVLAAPHGFVDSTNVLLASAGGVTVGNCWLLLWWLTGSPLLSLLVATLTLGYLVTSLLFYTVLADISYMESDLNYWLSFLCCMLLVVLLVATQPNRANILACCIVGSYAAIVPLDLYIGANLKYIFINSMRRATVPTFNLAIIDPPFQTRDTILSTLWVVLAVVGYILQAQRFGNRPPFPRSPHWSTPSASLNPLLSETRPLLYGQPVTSLTPGSDDVFT